MYPSTAPLWPIMRLPAKQVGVTFAVGHVSTFTATAIGAAMAVPFGMQAWSPAFRATAIGLQDENYSVADAALDATAMGASETSLKSYPAELKSIGSLFHIQNLFWVVVRNVAGALCIHLNAYLLQLFDHEKRALELEEAGLIPPPAPPIPSPYPTIRVGLHASARELCIATIRRIYEHIAVDKLPPGRAQPFLRDSRLWIRDVLAIRFRNASTLQLLSKYFFAIAHGTALYYAADCTFYIGLHTVHTAQKSRTAKHKITYWLRGVAAHVVRCSVALCVVSSAAALGSLIKPGRGTYIAQFISDLVVNMCMAPVVIMITGS